MVIIVIPSYIYAPLPHTGTVQHWPGRCWSGAPRSCRTCPAPPPCPPLGRRVGVGTLWAGTWDYDFKNHVMVSDSEPVELLLVLVPLDAVQGLPMQVILAPQRHRLVHLGICSYSDAAFITDLCYPHLHQIKLSRYVIICVLRNPGLKIQAWSLMFE